MYYNVLVVTIFSILRVYKMANMLLFLCLSNTHSFEKLSILRACEAQD